MQEKVMYKCVNCEHKKICKDEMNMKKFTDELVEKTKLLEYQHFGIYIECQNYDYYDKTKPKKNFKKITI